MNIHRVLFYLLLALLPTQLTNHFFPEFAFIAGIRVDYLAPVIYGTDLLVLAILLVWLFEKIVSSSFSLHLQTNIRTALIITTTLVFINIFFAINPMIALLKWLRILEAALLVFYITQTKPNLRISSYCLLFSGFYSCLIAWLQFTQQSSIGGIFWWIGERTFTITTPGIARFAFNSKLFLRPYAILPHPNVLAGFLTSLIPLLFYNKNANATTKLFFVPTLIIFLATIAVTFSQGAWIAATIVTVIFVVKERGVKLTKLLAVIGIIFTVGIFIVSAQLIERESMERRIALMKNSFTLIQDNPWFGVGLNNFIVANEKQISISSYQDLQPVHSIYLLFISETGIVGILLIAMLIYSLYYHIKLNNNTVYFIWPFVILLILGFIDHYPLTIHQTLLLASILLGMVIASSRVIR